MVARKGFHCYNKHMDTFTRKAWFQLFHAEQAARAEKRSYTEIKFIAGTLYARIANNLRNMDKMKKK
jgi:hypothetical protein